MDEKLSIENFLKCSPRKLTPNEINLIKKAFEFSFNAHKNQKRMSGAPYFSHCYYTALTLLKMNLDAETVAAGLLHDTEDDAGIKNETIRQEFSDNIAFLVEGVTKLGKLKYRGIERQVENLRKMFLAMAQDIRVVLIKLADRLHNMQTLYALRPDKQVRIAQETLEIYAPIAYRLGMGELKGTLEDLAFKYVYPNEYKWIIKNSKQRYKDMQYHLEKMKNVLKKELEKNGILPISMHARLKHLYSLYRKLQRYDMNFDNIYDIAALRIIVKTKEECYATLGIIHKIRKPLPGRIKDYISVPKPNGYQSLHTTVFTTSGRIIEIQIRTPQMHEEAEFGIAAHWAYSEQGKPKKGGLVNQKKFVWVKQLQEWQKSVSGTEEFLESLKIDFFKDRIFTFTPRGDVIDLPEGATPIDFAYEIHTDIGNHCAGAKVNNKMVSLDTPLKNGDVVEIMIQKNKKPSAGWLDFVKTSQARTRIRSFLKK